MTKVSEAKEYADDYELYPVAGGTDVIKYPSFDLGLKTGAKQPVAVLTLDSDGNEDAGVFADKTEDARSLTGSTFTAIPSPSAQYDAMYVCFDKPPCGLQVNINTAGIDAAALAAAWEYVRAVNSEEFPTTWTDLNEEDNTASAANKGLDSGTGLKTVKFIVPSDFIKAKIEGIEGYWIKFMVNTLGYSTAPVLESVGVVLPEPAISLSILESLDGDCDLHLNSRAAAGVVTDNTAITVTSGEGVIQEKFLIYNCSIKNLAAGKSAEVYVEAAIGGHDGTS